jgi:signal transduction histidine kinase
VAYQWRIRHKLILGLGLVVGIMALLLAGTLKGLMSYMTTMKTMDSKLAELHEAEAFKVAVTDLAAPAENNSPLEDESPVLLAKIDRAEQALAVYEEKLRDTVDHQRDPDKGFHELQVIDALKQRFANLKKEIKAFINTPSARTGHSISLRMHGPVKKAIDELVRTSDELQEAIYQDLYRRITSSKGDYRSSLWIVVATSLFGIVLLASLLRFFYRWVFHPIHDLECGVGRVAQGDFDHRIEVHSGDEMEDLAAAFNDMTERLREIYRDLAHQVNERSRQLVRSERLAGVGFLAAGVAHEINNPLASIAFCSEALEARLSFVVRRPSSVAKNGKEETTGHGPRATDEDHEVILKYLRMIQQEAFRCKAITQRLLEFSRSGERHREHIDLGELVQAVFDMVQHLQNYKGKKITFEPQRVVAWVNGQEIKSVVLNLVVNALDSMEDGGTLTIQLRQRMGMAELVFADTGCGMSEEVLENIFEPFFTRSRTGKGTGLGLTISHRIITQHGGEIEAASPGLNQGSTFTVRLPMQPAEPVKEETLGRAAA